MTGGDDIPDGDHVAEDAHSRLLKQAPCHAACRHPHCRLACACALQSIAHVFEAVLDMPYEVRVARTGHGDDASRVRLLRRLHGHLVLPVAPVAVADQQRNRSSSRHAETNPGQDLGLVRLYLHPCPAAVSLLPAPQLPVDELRRDTQARGHSVHNGGQRLPVRFARRKKSQHMVRYPLQTEPSERTHPLPATKYS